MSRNPKPPRKHTGLIVVLILMILLLIAATGLVIKMCVDITTMEAAPSETNSAVQLPGADAPTAEETEEPTETTMPEPEKVIATASLVTTGDLLMHMPVVDTCKQGDGSYNFDSIFMYAKDYVNQYDFAAANLETTLAGTAKPYSGYPAFNCPDAIVTGAKDAGFDMLLTANNHSYDTGLEAYKRTVQTVEAAGLTALGTYDDPADTKWHIQDINGIKVGMLCYTYAYSVTEDGRPSLNGMPHIGEAGLCNYFYTGTDAALNAFYTEVDTYLDEMEAAGAEATIMYIHWGVEYQTYANDSQKEMAQELCDLGIDVIIGGHPHVIQPMDLLTSTEDPDHKTVILYSMGNAVSNQRQGNISYIKSAHTEDGVLFSVTFEKYSDGEVYLAETDLIPCWVYRRATGGRNEYNILPLKADEADQWVTKFELPDYVSGTAQKSYDRTMAIVGEGLAECQDYLTQSKVDREQYYYDLVFHPEKFLTEPTEAPTEATVDPTAETGETVETTEAA